jgi:hypothetical protein
MYGNKCDQNVGMFPVTVLWYTMYTEFLFLCDIGLSDT